MIAPCEDDECCMITLSQEFVAESAHVSIPIDFTEPIPEKISGYMEPPIFASKISPTNFQTLLLLMVQKSQTTTVWMVF